MTATRSGQIEAEVRSRILRGELGQGVQIRQEALAEELGVSRIPVREALARLQQEGILVLNHNRGFEVRRLSRDDVLEIFELRLALEPKAIAEASLRASSAEQQNARRMLNLLDEEMDRRGSRIPEHNLNFHRALITPCGRLLTIQFLERLLTLVRVQVGALPDPETVKREHHQMLAAWIARDAEGASSLATEHIRSSIAQLGL